MSNAGGGSVGRVISALPGFDSFEIEPPDEVGE